MKKEESYFIRPEPCEVFSGGHTYCFSCHRDTLSNTDSSIPLLRDNCRVRIATLVLLIKDIS